VFLTGRTRDKLDEVASEITAADGQAEVAVVDALDEQAVEDHARAMSSQAGSIDVSFNLISRGDVQGIPLADMATADFLRAITTGITTNFITARAAARHMIGQGSGVILALNSGSAHGSPMMAAPGRLTRRSTPSSATRRPKSDRTRPCPRPVDGRSPRDPLAGEARRRRQRPAPG
jgi:NADP-dependent 3-hydroxy acid dehydrogenase YdfG